jgi:putative tricarboxylic transport membrane protein
MPDPNDAAVEDPDPGADSPAVTSTRTVEIAASLVLLAFAGVMAFDNWRTGMGWAPDGPKAGYFPFYLSVILAGASVYMLAGALRRSGVGKGFVSRAQLRRVLQMFVPTALFCLATQLLGLYVASLLLVAGFMRFVGRISWWKSIVTSLVFAGSMFLIFNVAFDVIMPKGPLEALLGR